MGDYSYRRRIRLRRRLRTAALATGAVTLVIGVLVGLEAIFGHNHSRQRSPDEYLLMVVPVAAALLRRLTRRRDP